MALSTKCKSYLRKLVKMEGFGETPEEVIERFVWDGINRLIEANRLSSAGYLSNEEVQRSAGGRGAE